MLARSGERRPVGPFGAGRDIGQAKTLGRENGRRIGIDQTQPGLRMGERAVPEVAKPAVVIYGFAGG